MPLRPIRRRQQLVHIIALGSFLGACRTQGAAAAVESSEASRIRSAPPSLPAVAQVAKTTSGSPSTADTTEYLVLMAGRSVGRLRQWPDTAGSVTTSYSFDDRGRGPSLVQTIRMDRAGLPVAMQVSGTSDLKIPVRETLRMAGPLLTWRNENAAGRGKPGSGYYLPFEALPTDIAALAKALQRTRSKSLAILPEGSVTLTAGAARQVSAGGNTLRVAPFEIVGLGLAPTTVWLDAEGRLFASGGSWQMVVRRGFESAAAELIAAELASSRTRHSVLAARLGRMPRGPVAIIHANLFDAVERRMKPSQTVIVRGDRITMVGNDGSVTVPAAAQIIDAANRTLLPGLWDMHVRVQDDDGLLHLAAGVTTVRDMANDGDALRARRTRFDNGSLLGPRIIAAGVIDGTGPSAGPGKVLVSTRDAARAAVEAYAGMGYEQVTLQPSLQPSLVQDIVRTAHQRGMRVGGHAPYGMTAEQMVKAGADELQHANVLFLNFLADSNIDTRTPARFTSVARYAGTVDLKSDAVTRFITLLKERNVVVDPTLNLFEQLFTARPGSYDQASLPIAQRMPPIARRSLLAGGLPSTSMQQPVHRSSFIAMERLVRALHEGGVRLVAGTDAGTDAQAGFSYHRELELLSEAGIPNTEILYIATLGASRIMKHDTERGSIEAGRIADLVLIDGDPSQRMRDIRRAEFVMKGGVLYLPDSLYAAVGVKPAPRKGRIPTREIRADDVVCRGRAAAVKKGEPVPLDCAVTDSTRPRPRRPATAPRRRVTPPTNAKP